MPDPHFHLVEPPFLSRTAVDRADAVRRDPERLAAGWSGARVLAVDPAGRFPVTGDGAVRWIAAPEFGREPPPGAVFLGVSGGDSWAVRVPRLDEPASDPRFGAHRLGPEDAALLATAVAMLNWHATAEFSPVDGRRTVAGKAGWVRVGEAGGEEYPRTDPAVIMLVHDGADHVLLGRQQAWQERWFSTLAGFVEPGESLEHCVIREVAEEAGIVARDPRYLGSQPWPFPRSLMLGFAAIADPDEPITRRDGELAEARWFHRDEVRRSLDSNWQDPNRQDGRDDPRLLLPPSVSIARTMIHSWALAR